MTTCGKCRGTGRVAVESNSPAKYAKDKPRTFRCERCKGTGKREGG
jgi:DnaJ-class molecular chaperone